MKNVTKLLVFVVAILVAVALATHAGAYPTVYPTGTTIYKPDQAYNGFLLIAGFAPPGGNSPNPYIRSGDPARLKLGQAQDQSMEEAKALEAMNLKQPRQTVLIDMMGNIVHAWPSRGELKVVLLPNGNLFEQYVEYDWNGNVVRELKSPTKTHHDGRVLPNGNYLLLCYEDLPKEKLSGVKDVEVPWWGLIKRSGIKLIGDTIIEMTPDQKVVWEWKSSAELDINRFSPVNPENDWTHGNTISPIPENRWYDAGDKRFKPGNIIYNPRNLDQIVIIDKETKKIVWSWAHSINGGLSHPHSVDMIPKGMPGEGNLILFDNGLFPRNRDHNGQSMVLEINPVAKEIVWKYETMGYSNMKFFSKTQGFAQRLPNGNTLIIESNTGRAFQVKTVKGHPDGGEIVWEYIHNTQLGFDAMYPYDYMPQLKSLPHKEMVVTPPDNLLWKLTSERGGK